MPDPELAPTALQAAVAELGFELVDVEIGGRDGEPVVKLRIDLPGGSEPGHGVGTDDCARVSRALEHRLEESGAVGGRWRLEVSSPGLERPVRFVEHWRRYLGRDIKLRLKRGQGGGRSTIVAVPDDHHVEVLLDGTKRVVPLEDVRSATLVVDWSAIWNQ